MPNLSMQAVATLIVDDSQMITKIIKKALLTNTIDGYHFDEKSIYIASDGMEAFDIMGKYNSIKLIISDINMPNLNGDEFIEILNDIGKLKDLDVVFVTSSSTKLLLKPSIKEHILGIIYKPFKYDVFNEQLKRLQDKKIKRNIELKQIKATQVKQKENIKNVCVKYLSEFQLIVEDKILTNLINESFANDEIGKDEYHEMIYAILSTYIFEIEHSHVLNSKKILCILKSFEINVEIRENRFNLIGGFQAQITYVNSNDLALKEVFSELTKPLLDKISIAFVKAKNFPKLKSNLFSPYFEYITTEFEKIDCLFMDNELKKLLIEEKELAIFNKWMYDFIDKNKLYSSVDIVKKSSALKFEVTKRLRKAYQQSLLLSQHYCGQIEFYIWKKAKDSVEITAYLKNNMPNTIPNSSRFLLHRNKITTTQHSNYLAFEKQQVIVVSNDLEILKTFKEIVNPPFNQWNFLGFTKLSLLEGWLNNNQANKIIIDYSYSVSANKNGVQFLKYMINIYPSIKEIVKLHQVYIISNNNQLVELHEHKKSFDFSIIHEPIIIKELHQDLLYK